MIVCEITTPLNSNPCCWFAAINKIVLSVFLQKHRFQHAKYDFGSDQSPDPGPGLAFGGQSPEGLKAPRASWSPAGSFQMLKSTKH